MQNLCRAIQDQSRLLHLFILAEVAITAVEKPQLITLKLQKLTGKVVLNLDCNVINNELCFALNVIWPPVLHRYTNDGSEKKGTASDMEGSCE